MGIPGLRGGDHIGITVPDMEQAHEFLVGVLGCEFVYALPQMRHDDDWMRTHLLGELFGQRPGERVRCGEP